MRRCTLHYLFGPLFEYNVMKNFSLAFLTSKMTSPPHMTIRFSFLDSLIFLSKLSRFAAAGDVPISATPACWGALLVTMLANEGLVPTVVTWAYIELRNVMSFIVIQKQYCREKQILNIHKKSLLYMVSSKEILYFYIKRLLYFQKRDSRIVKKKYFPNIAEGSGDLRILRKGWLIF